MSIIQGTAKQGATRGFYPLNIEQSLRFNDNDSAYLSRTPASAGNRKTWTWSGWVKRTAFYGSARSVLFSGYSGSSDSGWFEFGFGGSTQSDIVDCFFATTATQKINSSGVYRDPSAWYHFVVAVDTTQATASDRLKVWVNGINISVPTLTSLSLNLDTGINQTASHSVGKSSSGVARQFDGYLAEVHFVDGTAYDADAFGEFKSGVWVAKSPSVTYGTNGFYLDFANSADIGNDVSGEGNDWTPNNFTASDVVLDSPTDNFCTWNPLAKNSAQVLADGNLLRDNGSTWTATLSTIAIPSSGKWYAEFVSGDYVFSFPGIQTVAALPSTSAQNIDFTIVQSGEYRYNGSNEANTGSIGTGDVIGVAVDADSGIIKVYVDNVLDHTFTATLDSNKTYFFSAVGSADLTANFGQLGFTYTPPTGYLALSTANLPEPTISPADDASPSDYFNTVLYTGTGATQSITGVGFQPDLVWLKNRATAWNNCLFDAVRGTEKLLQSNLTNAETTNDVWGYLSSFNTDGFSLVAGSSGIDQVNQLNDGFVAWNWKANGSGVSNTDGTITSTVSANTTSGFSIVSYTGNGTLGATVGHGLSVAPELVIAKSRTGTAPTNSWHSYHASLGATQGLILNGTNAASTDSGYWSNTAPTSSVITVGTYSSYSSQEYVIYAFHSVEGFSKFGSYTGNGSADGPFVYTGFRPAFIITKRTDSTSEWVMIDATRDTYNYATKYIYANASSAEASSFEILDILSNGFKQRSVWSQNNVSGASYIYMAFAENPFKYSLAR